MTNEELKKILENHRHWLHKDCEGWEHMSADLSYADLRGADLRFANLRGANLRFANLIEANLREANLIGANLIGANLIGADLRGADLCNADIVGADLRGADIVGADLRDADLRGAKGCYQCCPCEGEFIAWKKASDGCRGVIVKLLIPAEAKRSSATTGKCRADKAIVLEIQDMDGNKIDTVAYSRQDDSFKYVVGETVTPKEPFCEDRWQECASGIHFFVDRRAAVEY